MNKNKSTSPTTQLNDIGLSPAGHQRKCEMLNELQGELGSLNKRRRNRKRLFVAATTLWVIGLGFVLYSNIESRSRAVVEQPVDKTSTDEYLGDNNDSRLSLTEVETNRSDVVDRYVVSACSASIEIESISDDEMLKLFKEMGTPSFLGKVGGQLQVFPPVGSADESL